VFEFYEDAHTIYLTPPPDELALHDQTQVGGLVGGDWQVLVTYEYIDASSGQWREHSEVLYSSGPTADNETITDKVRQRIEMHQGRADRRNICAAVLPIRLKPMPVKIDALYDMLSSDDPVWWAL
jgi:hypothetical protein